MLNIVCTSKPADGLLFYSYEYCSHLNEKGIRAQVYVVTHRDFTSGDYTQAISDKYIHCENIVFNNDYVEDNCISLIMGRSMLTLAHMTWNDYRPVQQESLKKLFGNKLISVYSENHPEKYPLALEFFNPKKVIDLCDTDVYPNGVGAHFEKIIHFPIYKEVKEDIQFNHLFLGTNPEYYKTVQKIIDKYPDHGILTYPQKYLDLENNNLRCPVDNLLGKFKTYVYTKDTFDPAPRLFQEARWLGKEIIYLRNDDVKDGGYWYWKRGIKEQDLSSMITAIDEMNGKISLETDLAVRTLMPQVGYLDEAENIKISYVREALVEQIKKDKVWFCSIPFLMAFTDEEGNYAQCNFGERQQLAHGEWNLKYKQGNTLHDTSIKEWMTGHVMEKIRSEMVDEFSNFEYVNHHCKKCINDEAKIGRSRRIIANEIYQEENRTDQTIWPYIMDAAARSKKGEKYRFEGRILEIQVKSFGIECNLDCQMCHHMSSSIRTKMAFDNGVWNDVVWGDKEEARKKSEVAMWPKPVGKINKQILDLAPYIYNLKIIGGEPLVMKKHYELLQQIIDIGEAKNMQLKYQTNATTLAAGKHNVLKYIPHFKSVLVVVSLDSVGKANDYIRRRSDYDTIVKNIREFQKYPNVQVDINSVATFFSVFNMYKIREEFPEIQRVNWWPIDDPRQMKANNLPTNLKDVLIEEYKKWPEYSGIVDLLMLPQEPDFNAKELYKYCMDMDKSYEGTKWEMNLLDVFPWLKRHYFITHDNKGWNPREYAIELPQVTGIVNSVQDFHKEILKKKPKGEMWYEGITHHRIPKDHEIYNIINKELFHTAEEETNWSGKLNAEDLKAGKHVAEVRAYLSEQKGGISFVPHVDSGFVLIFPFKIEKNSNYKLQYLNDGNEVIYEHEYTEDDNGDVVGILHNGPSYQHTVRWDSPKDKWWVQIILNPKEGGWKELCEHLDNNKLFKGEKHGSIRITR